MAAITPSGQSADNIQVEAQALIADGVNTAAGAATVAAPGGPALGALGGAGDIQRPPGAAAEMAIGEFWPSISENDIQRVVDEHRAAEQRFSDYGDTLKRKRSESPNLLQGQAGDARVERLTEMMNHAYAVADHLGSKAVTGESYKSTVVGLKTDLTRIGDAAQKAWEAAQTAKTPFSVAPYKTEAATAQSVALGDIAAAPPPEPMPDYESDGSATPVDHKTQEHEPTTEKEDTGAEENANEPDAEVNEPGSVSEQVHKSNSEASPLDGSTPDIGQSHAPMTEAPTQPVSDPGTVAMPPVVGTPTGSPGMPTNLPAAGTPSAGAGVGSMRPPQMPSGLSGLSGGSLKDAATAPAASMSEALSSNPVSSPNPLSSAASSFQSGLASGMGASGAVTPTPPLEKFAGPHPSSAGTSSPGGQVPVVPAQGAGAPAAPAVPSGPAPAGGGGMAPPASPGGGGLVPYVPPGGGSVPPPGAATLPTSAQPVQPPGSSAQSAGGPPVVASSSGSGAAAGAVAASEPLPSAELVLARRILDGLVRGTEVREDLFNGGFVQWAVSVLALPTGQLVSIASTVGDGAYVPPGVVIPVSATLAVYDRALPVDWAHRFVGVGAAAKLLTAHAEELARVTDVRPAAMVSSELGVQRPREWRGEFEAVRNADILLTPGEAPTAGGGYHHRLAAAAPDIWAKTQGVGGWTLRAAGSITEHVLAEAHQDSAAYEVATDRGDRREVRVVDAYDLDVVVPRLRAGTPVDWDAHLADVDERRVLHPAMVAGVLDDDDSEISQQSRVVYEHFYRAGLIVEMLRCWRDQVPSLPDVAYCAWAAGYRDIVDRVLSHAVRLAEEGR